MRNHQHLLKAWFLAMLFMSAAGKSAFADPVWHCSRSDVQIADASNDFTLAALTLEREVIRVALRDLHAVYQGVPVRMNAGLPLSACVVGNNSTLTTSALQSLGVTQATLKALAQQNSLNKSNIHVVKDEDAMLSCITKNHPAIGYLSKTTQTEAVGPCF